MGSLKSLFATCWARSFTILTRQSMNTRDAFVPLMQFKHAGSFGKGPIYIELSLRQRGVIDIDATVQRNMAVIPDLLAALDIRECDIVASYFGIGKETILKILGTGMVDYPVVHLLHIMKKCTRDSNDNAACILIFRRWIFVCFVGRSIAAREILFSDDCRGDSVHFRLLQRAC